MCSYHIDKSMETCTNEKQAKAIASKFKKEYTKKFLKAKTVKDSLSFVELIVSMMEKVEFKNVLQEPILSVLSMSIWNCLKDEERDALFNKYPKLERHWRNNATKKGDAEVFVKIVQNYRLYYENDEHWKMCMVFFIKCLSQLNTRRFVKQVLISYGVGLEEEKDLGRRAWWKLYLELLYFEVDEHTGKCLSKVEAKEEMYEGISELQNMAFEAFPEEMKSLYLKNIAHVGQPDVLNECLRGLSKQELKVLNEKLNVYTCEPENEDGMRRALVNAFGLKKYTMERDNDSCFPSEEEFWNENINVDQYAFKAYVPIVGMQLQFLGPTDYAYRALKLSKYNSIIKARNQISPVIANMKGRKVGMSERSIKFVGKHAKGAPIAGVTIAKVEKPFVGHTTPRKVVAKIVFNLTTLKNEDNANTPELELEWENLKPNDLVYFATIRPKIHEALDHLGQLDQDEDEPEYHTMKFADQQGIVTTRGAVIVDMLDGSGNSCYLSMHGKNEKRKGQHGPNTRLGKKRTLIVELNTNQYQSDKASGLHIDAYENASLLIKLDGLDFKSRIDCNNALLDSFLTTEDANVIPNWMYDIFLGYGDPEASCATALFQQGNAPWCMRLVNTFNSVTQLENCFPSEYTIQDALNNNSEVLPLATKHVQIELSKQNATVKANISNGREKTLLAHVLGDTLATLDEEFSNSQIQAIIAGMQPGLNLVSTPNSNENMLLETASQLAFNLHYSFPKDRTVIVFSSQILLQQFCESKLFTNLSTSKAQLVSFSSNASNIFDLSLIGRVNAILSRRLRLLEHVEAIAMAMGMQNHSSDFASSCEAADFFYQSHIQPYLASFKNDIENLTGKESWTNFKLHQYFDSAVKSQWETQSKKQILPFYQVLCDSIKELFVEIQSYQPYEAMRTVKLRSQYYLMHHASYMVAAINDYARLAIELRQLQVPYANVIYVQDENIPELECTIPLLYQQLNKASSLRRLSYFASSNPTEMEGSSLNGNYQQSLHQRLCLLGVPSIQL